MNRLAILGAVLALAACAEQPAPVPVCPPPLICQYAPTIAKWDSGWLATHLLSANDGAVVADLNDAVKRLCGPNIGD
jgi:hypothetical protein